MDFDRVIFVSLKTTKICTRLYQLLVVTCSLKNIISVNELRVFFRLRLTQKAFQWPF